MGKKQAFTLPELLGVISLLAVLALLAIPIVNKNISNSKQKLYQVQIENIKQAAKDWMAIHTLELPDETIQTSITLGCLKAEGLLDEKITNPVSAQLFPNDMVVKIESISNQYLYTVDEKSGTSNTVPVPDHKCHFNQSAITS